MACVEIGKTRGRSNFVCTTDEEGPLVTVNDAAALFGVKPVTVRTWARRYCLVPGDVGPLRYSYARLCEIEASTRKSPNCHRPKAAHPTM